MPEIYVETYLGCDIYYYTPPDVPEAVYGSPCIAGMFYKKSSVKKRICEKQGGYWDGSSCDLDVEPPPDEEPHLEEIYRGIEIWHQPASGTFTAQVAPGYLAAGFTLEECRVDVDRVLAFLEPDEDPPDGLLAQIIAEVQTWVDASMSGWLQPTVEWVTAGFADAGAFAQGLVSDAFSLLEGATDWLGLAVQDLRDRWDNLTTQTIPDLWSSMGSTVTDLQAALDQKAMELTASFTKGLEDNREWTTNFLKLMDPTGFLKDPLGTVSAAFALWKVAADSVIIDSFREGLEEGLAE